MALALLAIFVPAGQWIPAFAGMTSNERFALYYLFFVENCEIRDKIAYNRRAEHSRSPPWRAEESPDCMGQHIG